MHLKIFRQRENVSNASYDEVAFCESKNWDTFAFFIAHEIIAEHKKLKIYVEKSPELKDSKLN